MGCRNTYLLTILVIVLLYFIVTKPIRYNKEYMTDELANDTYSYGGVPIIFNNDPSDINYYRTNIIDGNLNIPNSQILTNKKLYEYNMATIPKEKNISNLIQNEKIMNQLVDSTYYCDDIMNRELVDSYLYDSSQNRYGSIQESYFD